MNTLSSVFLTVLALGTLFQLWLTSRQAAYVAGHADAVPSAFSNNISLDEHRKAARYTLSKLAIERWELVIGPAILLFWTLAGGLNWLDQQWLSLQLTPLWHGTALILSTLIIGMLLDLPLSLWNTFKVEVQYGFNRTTPARFIKDKLLELALVLLLGLPLIMVILWLMDSAGPNWWLWAWLVWMSFTLFMTWAFPIWIAPIFNKFEPLAEGDLHHRLEDLLTRCGFTSNGMFVMDGSQRSAHGNAYFTGFGRNKRIVYVIDQLLHVFGE